MGEDILNLYGEFDHMQHAYVDFNAVEKTTAAVRRWTMLGKLCHLHASGLGTASSPVGHSTADTSTR